MATKSATITVDANLATAYNAAPKIRQKKAQAAMRRVLQESPETKPTVPHLSPQETALFLRHFSFPIPVMQPFPRWLSLEKGLVVL